MSLKYQSDNAENEPVEGLILGFRAQSRPEEALLISATAQTPVAQRLPSPIDLEQSCATALKLTPASPLAPVHEIKVGLETCSSARMINLALSRLDFHALIGVCMAACRLQMFIVVAKFTNLVARYRLLNTDDILSWMFKLHG